ncbi:MAG: hypothetical protein DMD64_11015 [Gemmatimonadetes bacterium]|nr:MAG: hypothetical protein DMD64_11015 [Gemmatimonadota bacterium]
MVRLRLMSILGEWVARDLRDELYEHIQRLSLAFFSRKRTGSLITRVSADTDRLWEFLAFGVVDVSLSLVQLLGLGTVLLTLDWKLGLVMTLPIPVFCWVIYRHGENISRLFIRAWRKWSRVTDVLSDTIPGIRVVKAFNQEDREIVRFGERNEDVTAEFNRIHRSWTTFWPLLILGVHAMTVTVYDYGVAVRRAAAARQWGAAPGRNVRLVPALHDDVPGADRRDRADGAHDQPGDDVGASRVRGARYRARDTRRGGAGAARAGARPGYVRARDVRLRRRPPGAAWRELRRPTG